MPKLKNILIFGAIAVILILIYIFFLRPAPDSGATLISSTPGTALVPGPVATGDNSSIAQDFLTLLLSVKSIKLNDAIFSDPAFASLTDSSIVLIPDGTEGRPNPFAPLGSDAALPTSATPVPVVPLTTPSPAANPPIPPPSTVTPSSTRPATSPSPAIPVVPVTP